MEELPLNVKIKQEKLTPERVAVKDDIEKVLESNLSSKKADDEETLDKKEIEPSKTSDQLLEELFGSFGANVNIPDLLNNTEKKSKKKKKRKREDSDADSSKSKHKKSKKSKKVKQEPESDKEDSKERVRKAIKKENRDKEKGPGEKVIKKEVTGEVPERRKLSIVIKDLKFRPEIGHPSSSKSLSSSTRDKERDKERERDKKRRSKERDKERKARDKKALGNVSDISLSDEETYRKMLEYHTSSQWLEDRNNHIREWDRDKYRRGRSRDDDRHSSRHYRQRSRSRSRSRSRKHSPIDKKKLLEIARKNAISMLRNGQLPRNISENTKEKLITKIKDGGKSIEELTNYCKRLSKAEDLGELSLSDSDNDGDGKPKAFHHPFEVKDRGPIVMNIRNSVPIVPKQASELKAIMSQFPVSSGKQHQKVENTWVPVTKSTSAATITTVATISKPVVTLEKQIQEQLPELARPKPTPVVEAPRPLDPALSRPYDWKSDQHYLSKSIIPELAPPPQPPVDVSEIISQRLNAMRKLQENPRDGEASQVLFETQQNMSQWAQSKYTPGQFLGSTDVRVLSAKELSSGSQAWARKNQLIDTQPVNSGMGMHLLKKMGWTPGEGLGKESNGSLMPLLLELKLDKRGLEANEEGCRQKQQNQNRGGGKKGGGGGGGGGAKGGYVAPVPLASLEQKHPVSLLGELASKRKWGAPNYTLVFEQGPAHAKNFIFKVSLNGIDYTCPTPSNNKKEAKSSVAKFCLQQLGILPS